MIAAQDQLTQTQSAVRDYFQRGGSIGVVIVVGLVLVALFVLTYVLTRRQDRQLAPPVPNDPHQLFEDLLRQLPLTDAQRDLLRQVAHDQQLDQPSILLVSPDLFNQHVKQWHKTHAAHSAGPSDPARTLADIQAVLFPAS